MLKFRAALLMAAVVLLAGVPSRADPLLNSHMTGTLQLTAAPSVPNWYDPSYCHCAGDANAAGATVAIGSSYGDTIFGANLSPLDVITADLSVTSTGDFLTINVVVLSGAPEFAWTQTFQDAALVNFTMAQVPNPLASENPFPANTLTFAPKVLGSDTLSFTWNPTGVAQGGNQNFTATFALTDPPFVPEPSSAAVLAVQLGAIGLFALCRLLFRSAIVRKQH